MEQRHLPEGGRARAAEAVLGVMHLPVRSGDETVYVEVDSVDFLWASQFAWHLNNGYASRSQRRGHDQKPYRMLLHREIVGLKHSPRRGIVVDHINGNPLDCRRSNLRLITEAQNAHNRKDRTDGTSRYRGVSWYTAKGCWRVHIMVNGHRTLVGYFDDEDEAGRAAENFYAQHMPHRRQSHPVTASGPGTEGSGIQTTYSFKPGRLTAVSEPSDPLEAVNGHADALDC